MEINNILFWDRDQVLAHRINNQRLVYGLNGIYQIRNDGSIDVWGLKETLSATHFNNQRYYLQATI